MGQKKNHRIILQLKTQQSLDSRSHPFMSKQLGFILSSCHSKVGKKQLKMFNFLSAGQHILYVPLPCMWHYFSHFKYKSFVYFIFLQHDNQTTITSPCQHPAKWYKNSLNSFQQSLDATYAFPQVQFISAFITWQYHSTVIPSNVIFNPSPQLTIPLYLFPQLFPPRSRQLLGRGQHPAVRHPGSGIGNSCPNNCSR